MGKQIRIYLADGTSTGVRHAEITNWSGQALACPRNRFSELKDWGEIKRPGVYLLFGIDEETGEDAVYIGESEVVIDRLKNHLTSKEFWSELIAFTSKDDHLTKSHVKYLECRLVQLTTLAGRYRITNGNLPPLPSLPRADKDAMEEFLASIRSLIGVLGHKVLDPLVKPANPSLTSALTEQTQASSAIQASEDSGKELPVIFELRISGRTIAEAEKTDEGFVVRAGANVAEKMRESLSGGYRALREKLKSSGAIAHQNGQLKLLKDHLFTSPSQAAAILVGYAINGRDCWKTSSGISLGAYEQKIADKLINELLDKV
ncbi:GIY-YIG nuclease family protein [Diaphorobacter sp. HDW4A]|uniref:GIY-YIG nuclease family protein n=1 Tax=Diaphorobacter sp. HDW4A TaxID=2714924 RepID=UPI0019815BD9|nr:GIY-YIG nuclease family protein [Diaphorobacter sp. HDW4A]